MGTHAEFSEFLNFDLVTDVASRGFALLACPRCRIKVGAIDAAALGPFVK